MILLLDLKNDVCEHIENFEVIENNYPFAGQFIKSYEFNLELNDSNMYYIHDWYLNNYDHDHKMNCSTIKRDLYIMDNEIVYILKGTLSFENDSNNIISCSVSPDFCEISELKKCTELILFHRDKKIRQILNESQVYT